MWMQELQALFPRTYVQAGFVSAPDLTLGAAARAFGLDGGEQGFVELSRSQAMDAGCNLLRYGFISFEPFIEETVAARLMNEFFQSCSAPNARYFSNGRWDLRHRDLQEGEMFLGFDSHISWTYDGGVIMLCDRCAWCFWLGEED